MPALTAAAVKAKTKVGFYADSKTHGLYLAVHKGGSKSWTFRFQLAGKRRRMGLGPVDAIGLAEAREAALAARRVVLAGIDPIEQRRASVAAGRAAAAKLLTFEQVAEECVASRRAGWRNAKHAAQWTATLAAYVYPVFGRVPVDQVDTGLVVRALKAIWETKPETATRVRQRIEAVLSYAMAHGYAPRRDNPAQWRGHLDAILPPPTKVRRVEHHPALPYSDVPAFMAGLRAQPGTAARALEFAILTAARTGEVIGARWREFDLKGRVWTVPAERMKAGREHRVALSEAAVALLGKPGKPDAYVFPGGKAGKALSNMALLMTLRRMGRDDLTAHGFRSTFSDWCAERTAFPSEVREMALAHAVGDKVEAAYRRGDMFEKRRRLADAWAKYCATLPAASADRVVTLR